jgi:hypothetical protein
MCHFFDDTEIENDIDPRDFESPIDHDRVVSYLKDISILLNKEVFVTDENIMGPILLKRSLPLPANRHL